MHTHLYYTPNIKYLSWGSLSRSVKSRTYDIGTHNTKKLKQPTPIFIILSVCRVYICRHWPHRWILFRRVICCLPIHIIRTQMWKCMAFTLYAAIRVHVNALYYISIQTRLSGGHKEKAKNYCP